MTAQTEVSKEVESIGEKCGLEASSYQNLPKENCNFSSHCDQVNDPDNSYVFVTGTDGLTDDHVVERENLLAAKGFSVEPAVDLQVENLIQEVDRIIKEGESVNLSVISGSNVPLAQESLPEVEVVGEQNGSSENAVENGIKSVVDLGNVAEAEIKEITDSSPRIESSKTAEKDMVGEFTGNFENEEEFETKSIEDVTRIIESPTEPEIESVGVTGVKTVGNLNGIPGADIESLGNQNENVVVQNDNVEKKVEDDIESEYSPMLADNVDSQSSRLVSLTYSNVSGSEVLPNIDDCEEKEPTFRWGDEHVEVEVSSEKTNVVNGSTLDVDVNLEPELHGSAALPPKVLTSDAILKCGGETSDGFDVNNKDSSNLVLEKEDTGDMQDQLGNATRNNEEISCLRENEDTEKSQNDIISIPLPKGSSIDEISGGDTIVVAETKPFNYLVRVPRFGDESLKEQIRLAKVKVDEMTKSRDVIQVQIQEKRANCQTHGIDYEYAKSEDRSARRLVRSKRMEIDSIQSVINKAKNAASIKDANKRISDIEYMIQHETLPLKEEKLFIREIKQLKLLREQISANLGTEDEIKQALELREEAEEQYKILKKELGVLKDKVLKAEAIAFEAGRKYDNEIKKVKELQAKYRAANGVRQEAYAQWQSLRKELSEKNKCFFKYKDAAAAAHSYAYRRERESVYHLCTNQVETFMELWNRDDEFRKEYMSFNLRSTLRRLGTSDGRSLGPDEQPHILPSSTTDERVHKRSISAEVDSISQNPKLKIETITDNEVLENQPLKKLVENKNQTVKVKEPAKSISDNGPATVLDMDVVTAEMAHEEESVKSKEEIELERKAEEMRKEEAESELREQRRLEELARANEARERKKRQAEKLQVRAEIKAQKEAEQKEKEREKRMRKKEKKKAGTTDDGNNHSDSGESTVENGAKEIEVIPSVVNKKYQKSKQSKSKSIPPTLRNRNRKKWQQYIYVGVASLFVLVLFWVGNIGLFSAKNLKRSGPFY